MSHEKSHAAILIGASDIRTAESAIQEFARNPLSRKVGSGNETSWELALLALVFCYSNHNSTKLCNGTTLDTQMYHT